MKRFLLCAALALSTTTLHASLIYSAFVSCSSCVTVSLSWANEPVGVSFAEVDDSLGNFLFSLNVPSPPRTTGSIIPNPQTISGLSRTTISVISNGQAGFGLASIRPEANVFATLNLEDSNHTVIDSSIFVADVTAATPEPAAWSLMCAGMVLLFFWMRRQRRRQSQT